LSPDELARTCWFLTGATATGKTRYGLALARAIGAEIVSLDSMAIYRGMDIGTAKPTFAEQMQVAHHLIDVVDPHEEFSVAEYVEKAHQIIADIRRRGREALFVGGSPLYLKALLRGISPGPPADWSLRQEIASEAERLEPGALHDRVARIDPIAAAAIHPNDKRRLIRAIEVYVATGQPISHQQLHFEEERSSDECRVFVLRRSRKEQHQRINQRVDDMIERGFVEEVRQLTSDGKILGRTARQAVGYNEVLDFLNGKFHLAAMADRIKARTRQFAKRQLTWFRSLSECRFIDLAGERDEVEVAKAISETDVST